MHILAKVAREYGGIPLVRTAVFLCDYKVLII